MQVDALATAAGDLARLRGHAASLRAVELPPLIGRLTRGGEIHGMLTGTAASVRKAERSLRHAGYGAAADSVAGVLTRLDDTKFTTKSLRVTGHVVDEAASGAAHRLRIDLADATGTLLDRDAAHHTDDSWRQLAQLLSIDGDGGITRMARPARGVESLVTSLAGPDDVAGARRIHQALRAGAEQDAEILTQAREIIAREPADISADEWQRLSGLLRSDPEGTLLSGPRRIEWWMSIDELAARGTDPRMHETLSKYFAPWRLALLPRGEKVALLRGILETAPDQVTPNEWRQVQMLMEHRPSLNAFADLLPGQDARAVLANVSGRLGLAPARRLHAHWNVTRLDDAGAVDAARRIFARSPERLTEGEWAHLEALLQRDALHGPRTLAGVNPLAWIAVEQTKDVLVRPSTPWDAAPYFSAWNEQLDPRHLERVGRALDAIVAGSATTDQLELVLINRARLGALVADRPPEQQRAIAHAMLRGTADGPGATMEGTLEVLRTSLDAPGAHGELEPLRLQTLELVERNLQRLRGSTPEGAVRGYSTHPDYAELGRARANLDLLEQVTRRHAREDATDLLRW